MWYVASGPWLLWCERPTCWDACNSDIDPRGGRAGCHVCACSDGVNFTSAPPVWSWLLGLNASVNLSFAVLLKPRDGLGRTACPGEHIPTTHNRTSAPAAGIG